MKSARSNTNMSYRTIKKRKIDATGVSAKEKQNKAAYIYLQYVGASQLSPAPTPIGLD